MFTAYDYLKEESIIAFKPDTRRGNYTKKEIGDADKNDESILQPLVTLSLVFDVLSSSMPESIFTTIKDTLAYIIPKNPGATEDVEIACPLRTIINRMNTGLYQVVVNKGEPIEYRIDDRAVNTLYMRVGDYYVLVWKLVVDDEMVSIKSRLDWTERGMVNVLWISIIFFVVVYAMYLTTQMAKNQQHCSLDSTCDVELLSSLRNRRTHLVVLFIVCLACYVLFLTYRRVVFRQRHLKDRKVFMRLLFGDKEEYRCFFQTPKAYALYLPELTSIQLGDDAFCYKGDDNLSESVMRNLPKLTSITTEGENSWSLRNPQHITLESMPSVEDEGSVLILSHEQHPNQECPASPNSPFLCFFRTVMGH
ncbi:hypothetical protein BLSTO_01888 [Blastocystis sp. subtype 1]